MLIRSALFKGESAKTFVETGHLTTSIQQTLIAAGPGRMRGGINIQCHRVAFLAPGGASLERRAIGRSEEHTSELQSLMRISYAVFCLKKKKTQRTTTNESTTINI